MCVGMYDGMFVLISYLIGVYECMTSYLFCGMNSFFIYKVLDIAVRIKSSL